jgi:uncharacterized RDD family membrane protein YckC
VHTLRDTHHTLHVTIHLNNIMNEIITEPNIGKRFLAGFVDYTIIYGVTIFLTFTYGEPNDMGEYSLSGLLGLIPIVFWLIMTVGLETGFGATLGNLLVGLKPVPISGTNRKLTFGESFKRHLLDPIDMFFFGLIGIVTIKNTNKNQRVGDIWARTIVVQVE